MNKYKIIKTAAFLVFAVAFCIWGYTELLYLDADVTYKDLQNKVVKIKSSPDTEDDSTTVEEPLLEIDHEKLLDENHDYICWLSACGNNISYPVVKGRTNEEYLHHTFFGDKSFVGSIFMDYRCSLSDFHAVLYGHSMKDRTMFRLIADYTDKAFADKYPYFYIYTPDAVQKYEIFSVYNVYDTELATAFGDLSEEEKQAFIAELKNKSLYSFAAEPSSEDNIISLITCDVRNSNKRVAVNGVLIK